MEQLHLIELWLPQDEIDALDQACAEWGPERNSRAWFVHMCLRYGLLSLRDDGLLTLSDNPPPEFVRWYKKLDASYLENSSMAAEPAISDIMPE